MVTDLRSAIAQNRSEMRPGSHESVSVPDGSIDVYLTPDYVTGAYLVRMSEDSEHCSVLMATGSYVSLSQARTRYADLISEAHAYARALTVLRSQGLISQNNSDRTVTA